MLLTITAAAILKKCSRQGIYFAIKTKRLKGQQIRGRWHLEIRDLEEYFAGRYSRKFSRFEGYPLFDYEKGERSVKQAAGILGISAQRIYYYLNTGLMYGYQKNVAWVIHIDEIERVRKDFIMRKVQKAGPSARVI